MLKVIRELLGEAEGRQGPISQQDLAFRLGISVPTAGRWERGDTPATLTIPQMKKFKKMLDVIHWDFDDLPDDLSQPKSA